MDCKLNQQQNTSDILKMTNPTVNGTWHHFLFTGFVLFFGPKLQGLFKGFKGHISHFSRSPCSSKSGPFHFFLLFCVTTLFCQ